MRPILIFFFGLILFALVISWFAALVGSYFSIPILKAMSLTSPLLTYVGFGNIIFLLGLPLVGLVLVGSRLIFRARTNRKWNLGLTGFWLLNLVSLVLISLSVARGFTNETENYTETTIPVTDSLMIDFRDRENSSSLQIDMLSMHHNKLAVDDVDLSIREAEGNQFVLRKEVTSRGATQEEAKSLATEVSDPFEVSENTLFVDSWFTIPTSGKWRNQEVELTLFVPPGKTFHIEKTYSVLSSVDVHTDQDRSNMRPFSGHWWTMKKGGAVKNVTSTENADTPATTPEKDSTDTKTSPDGANDPDENG